MFVPVKRNVPRVVPLRGYLLPRASRGGRFGQLAEYRAECPCGWAGAKHTNDTSARREAINHTCEETHS